MRDPLGPKLLDSWPAASPAAIALGVRWLLVAAALWGLYEAPWLSVAPNRLLPGEPISALVVLGHWTHAATALLALAAGLPVLTGKSRGALVPLVAVLLGLLILTGLGAGRLLANTPPSARAMAGVGFWTTIASISLLGVDDGRKQIRRASACAALAVGILAVAHWIGVFDALSIIVELHARADLFGDAFLRHLALSGAALLLGLAVSLPLGWLAFRSRRIRSTVDAVLSAVQVIPAVALLGFLVALLSFGLAAWPGLRDLGFAAIGPTPALIGVAAYLALPLTRSITAGFLSTEASVVEAARAMGMTNRRIAWEVRLPLGVPVFVGGLRVAVVQSIGLVTLGGLIGAGGLGTIVFEGMAQFASDVIILGAAPIIGIAVLADAALKSLERVMARPLA